VIDSKQDFQWTPNIHEILSDVKKETSLSLNLETIITRLGHRFINQTVSKIDGDSQTVTLDDKQTLNYDVLLITSGHTRSNYDIKGANKYAYGFRTADDVRQIHNDIEAVLQANKSPVNINIIGGGFTGIEVLGELLRKYSTNKQLYFNVIDILSQCKHYQVNFHFDKKITEVKKSSIHFNDNQSIESDLTIWSAGTKLPDYLDSIHTQSSDNGLDVNTYLQTKEFNNVFVAGDSATLPQPATKQASIALDMGLHAAININRFCTKKSLKAFKVSTKPVLLSLGDINTYFIQDKLVLASPVLRSDISVLYGTTIKTTSVRSKCFRYCRQDYAID
jgi:NADH:ubiquinone reductase (non-electrogenic)